MANLHGRVLGGVNRKNRDVELLLPRKNIADALIGSLKQALAYVLAAELKFYLQLAIAHDEFSRGRQFRGQRVVNESSHYVIMLRKVKQELFRRGIRAVKIADQQNREIVLSDAGNAAKDLV